MTVSPGGRSQRARSPMASDAVAASGRARRRRARRGRRAPGTPGAPKPAARRTGGPPRGGGRGGEARRRRGGSRTDPGRRRTGRRSSRLARCPGCTMPPFSTASASASSLLWSLSIRSPPWITSCGRSARIGVGGAREHPRRQRLLGAERRLERSAEAVEERDPCGRRGVEHVGVGDVGERCEHGDGRGAPAELGPVDQRLAGADAELTVSDRVGPGRDEGRARRRGGRGGTGAAAGERERRSAAEGFRQRPAAGDAPCGHGGRGGTRARGDPRAPVKTQALRRPTRATPGARPMRPPRPRRRPSRRA